MGINIGAEGGSSQLKQFTIFSNKNGDIDMCGGFLELYIYQSCLDNSVRATATFADTGFRMGTTSVAAIEQDDLDLTAGEKVHLLVYDGYGNLLSFLNEYQLRIQQLRNVAEHTGKNVFTLDFCSKESINNELVDNRVKQRFDGKISDSIQYILEKNLKTEKPYLIEETYNKFNFLGNNEKPFYKIPWLAKRSVPNLPNAAGNLAGYFFYEVPDDGRGNGGYRFKSIDNFFTQTPKHKLIFNNTPFLPVGYTRKILSYSIDNLVSLNSISSGVLVGTKYKKFNPFTKKYEENSFYDSERMGEKYMGGTDVPAIASDLSLNTKDVKIYTGWEPIGILPSGSTLETQLSHIEKPDWNKEDIVRQAEARYNNLFNTRLNITIPGDFSINAGDILTCDFPEISGKASKIISNKKSGNYLVIDVAHRITSKNCYTTINLVRESLYKS